jgi:hypothetical protein
MQGASFIFRHRCFMFFVRDYIEVTNNFFAAARYKYVLPALRALNKKVSFILSMDYGKPTDHLHSHLNAFCWVEVMRGRVPRVLHTPLMSGGPMQFTGSP